MAENNTAGPGRWPDVPEAFLKAKAAMGCQLAEELSSGFGLRTRPSEHCVDVLSDGFAFRLFLSSERCVCSFATALLLLCHDLMRLAAKDAFYSPCHEHAYHLHGYKTLHPMWARDAAMAARIDSGGQAGVGPQSMLAAAAAHGSLQARARHHGAVAALAGAAPAFPAAAQLAGRWLAAQMLSNQLPQEGLELIVASAFLPDWGLPIPGATQCLHLPQRCIVLPACLLGDTP